MNVQRPTGCDVACPRSGRTAPALEQDADFRAPAAHTLVAGIGNLFLGDDGFGPEVIRRILAEGPPPPESVRILDYGIRGAHLAFDIVHDIDVLILVDAVPTRPSDGALGEGPPGELVVLEIRPGDIEPVGFDAHAMSPAAVLGNVEGLGGTLPTTYLVGCRIDTVTEEIGLTPRVEAAVPAAMAAVRTLLDRVPQPSGMD